MSDQLTLGNSTHPIGWTLIGAGSVVWGYPLLIAMGVPMQQLRETFSSPITLLLAVAGFTLAGLLLDFLTRMFEPMLKKLTGLAKLEPSRSDYAASWRVRWAYPVADQEFKRYEGVIALARVYVFHFAAAVATVSYAHNEIANAFVLSMVFAVLCLAFFSIWKRNTWRAMLIVRSANKWHDQLFD